MYFEILKNYTQEINITWMLSTIDHRTLVFNNEQNPYRKASFKKLDMAKCEKIKGRKQTSLFMTNQQRKNPKYDIQPSSITTELQTHDIHITS